MLLHSVLVIFCCLPVIVCRPIRSFAFANSPGICRMLIVFASFIKPKRKGNVHKTQTFYVPRFHNEFKKFFASPRCFIIQFKFFQFSEFHCAPHSQNNLNFFWCLCSPRLLSTAPLRVYHEEFSFMFYSFRTVTIANRIDFNVFVFACAVCFFFVPGIRIFYQ